MALDIVILLLSLVIILFSCEMFVNSVEWLGKMMGVGDGVVGSIFSAVGTCLPETIIPVITIIFTTDRESSIEIGIGAIVGAPFMLCTLAFFLTGASVLVFWKKRRTGTVMKVNNKIIIRDLHWFIATYLLGITAAFIKWVNIRFIVAVVLIIAYAYYVVITVKNDKKGDINKLEPLYFANIVNAKPGRLIVVLQTAVSLAGIIFGAELFIQNTGTTAMCLGISPLALSLVLTPIATELPEKFNSIIWISKKKDTLALGNITGAMVFQSCIPVAIGITATPWQLDIKAIVSAGLAVFSAFITVTWVKIKGRLNPSPLLLGGVFYMLFISFLIEKGFK